MAQQLSSADLSAALNERIKQQHEQRLAAESYSGLGGFLASALSAAGPEFVGLSPEKSDALRRWEGEHRIANFMSDLLGFGASYGALTAATGGVGAAGGLGALGRIPRVAKGANRALGAMKGTGTVGGELLAAGSKEMLRFAPVEAARLGLAGAVGDPGVVASHLPINMLAIGGIGAAFKGARMMMPFNSPTLRSEGLIADLHPEYRPFRRNQLRLEQLYELRARDLAEGKMSPELDNAYKIAIEGAPAAGGTEFPGLKRQIAEELPQTKVRAAVRQINGTEKVQRKLNELFKLTPLAARKYFTSRFLNHRKGGVVNTPKGHAALAEVLEALPDEAFAHMQFPRLIDTNKVTGSKAQQQAQLRAIERAQEGFDLINRYPVDREFKNMLKVVTGERAAKKRVCYDCVAGAIAKRKNPTDRVQIIDRAHRNSSYPYMDHMRLVDKNGKVIQDNWKAWHVKDEGKKLLYKKEEIPTHRTVTVDTIDGPKVTDYVVSAEFPANLLLTKSKDPAAIRWTKVESLFEDASHLGDLSYYKELESGMFVVLKRTGENKGIIFKTDNLGVFSELAKETPARMGAELWATGPEYNISTVLKDLGPLADELKDLMKAYPRYLDLTGRTPGETLEKLANVLSPATRQQGKRVTRYLRESFKKGFAPWLHVTSSSPAAVRLSSIGRQISSIFNAAATREFGGKVTMEMLEEQIKAGTSKAPIRNILGKALPTKGGMHKRIQQLSEEDFNKLHLVLAKNLSGKELSRKEFSAELIGFVKALQRLDDRTVKRLMAVQNWTGAHDFTPLARHMMMARLWTGSFRVRIVDAHGNFLGMGSGKTPAAAVADAKEVAATANRLLAETGTVQHLRAPKPQRLEEVRRELSTAGELGPKGKAWAHDPLAGPGEAIFERAGGGSVLVRRAEGSRSRVVFEAAVPEGPATLGKYSTPKEAAEAIERHLTGKGTKGPIEAQTWEVLQHGQDEDLLVALDPQTGLSTNPTAVEAMDRAFGEVLEKKVMRWRERKGAIGYQHYHKPLKRREVEEMVLGNLITSYRYMSSKIRDKLFEGEMAQLSMVNPSMAKEVQKRFARLDGVSGPITKQINKSVDALMAPIMGPKAATRISGAVTNAMFRLTLTAGDVGFPAVNAMTFLQTVYPEIALVRDLPREALQHLYSSSIVATKNGLESFSHVSPRKITNMAWKNLFSSSSGKNPELLHMIQRAGNEGIVSPRFVEEYLGKLQEHAGWNKNNIGESFYEFIKAMDSYMAGKSEQVSRLHAFLTGNIVGEMIMPSLKGEGLYNFAREFTERTMFLYNQAGRATAFTGPIGSAVGLFKNWPLHYLGNLAGMVGAGFRYGTWKPLAWSMIGTGTVAGIGGVPFFGLANMASEILSDDSLMNNLYNYMGYAEADPLSQRAIDSLYYGLPAFVGITFQGRAEAPSSHLMRDINQLGSMVAMDRAVASYRALGEFYSTWEVTGQNPLRNPRVQSQMARAFLPRTLYRSMQRTAQGAIKSLNTGSPLISDVGPFEHIWYSLGVTSTDIQRARDIQQHYYDNEESLGAMTSQFGQMLADARLAGDYRRRQELWKQAILVHNLPMDKLSASERAHYRHRTRPDSASQLSQRSQMEQRQIYGR
jgi:hypothetical protein